MNQKNCILDVPFSDLRYGDKATYYNNFKHLCKKKKKKEKAQVSEMTKYQ